MNANEIIILTRSEWKLRQQNTVLGFFLTLLNPLLVFFVVYAVFSGLFSPSRPDYALFLLTGLLQWNFLSLSTSYGLNSLLRRASLIKNYPFEPSQVVISSVLSVFLSHLAENMILVIIVSLYHGGFYPVFLLVFALDVALFFFAAAVSLIIASLNVFYYDTERLWSIILTGLFFITPVFYPKEVVNYFAYPFLRYNLLGSFMDLYRSVLLGKTAEPADMAGIFIISTVCLIISLYFSARLKARIQDYI